MAHTGTGFDPRMMPPPRPAPGVGRTSGHVRGPFGELPVEELRHPSEPSRFALALVAMSVPIAVALFVLVSLGQEDTLILFVLVIVAAVFLIWVVVQVWRIRLLGDAVLVSAQTLPEAQEVLDAVRERLAYTRRIDLFVVDKMSRVLSGDSAPVTLTSFFGVHVLVAEGEALGDLADQRERQQLLFTLATYVGALKARYAQWWSPLFTAFQMTGLARFARPFVLPYYRATVYSGDRIAYACCGDLDVSLQAVYRALVGKDVATHLRADGFTGQALAARRRLVLRIAQLLRGTPHATNRYLELLAFVLQRTPAAYAAHRPVLAGVAAEAEPVLANLAAKRASPGVVPLGVTLAGVVLVGGLALGLGSRDSDLATWIADGGTTPTPVPEPPVPQPPVPEPPAPEPPPAPTAEELLLEFLPADMRAECAPGASVTTVQPVASIACPLDGGRPQRIQLHAYETAADLGDAVDGLAAGVPSGDCSSGLHARVTWTIDGVAQGPMACYVSQAGETTLVWGSTSVAVLALAQDPDWSLTAMYEWWLTDAPYFQ